MVPAGARAANPYTPDWGVGPPVLVGRDEHLDRAERALRAGPRDPWFTHGYFGERGVGKTVLLDAIGARAQRLGWPVLHLATRAGRFLDALLELEAPAALRRLRRIRTPADTAVRVRAGVNLGVARAEAALDSSKDGDSSLATRVQASLQALGEQAARRDRGVLITVDEVHAADPREELPILSSTLQLLTKRRGLPIALVVAGLPSLPDLLSSPAMTFLERMPKVPLGFLSPDATRLALAKPAADRRVGFSNDALSLLAEASAGYPYFVQLLGYHAWEAAARRERDVIDLADAERGITEAAAAVVVNVYAPRWERLAPKEQDFLRAMAAHPDDPTPVRDIVAALGAERYEDISYLRGRLLDKGAIVPAGRGLLRFTFPGMREWVATARGSQ